MGSGSTALAARKCGRVFVGYEIEPSYLRLAQRRIDSAQQLHLPNLEARSVPLWTLEVERQRIHLLGPRAFATIRCSPQKGCERRLPDAVFAPSRTCPYCGNASVTTEGFQGRNAPASRFAEQQGPLRCPDRSGAGGPGPCGSGFPVCGLCRGGPYKEQPGYWDAMDNIVRLGIIQRWVSLCPQPLVVAPAPLPHRRNPKTTPGHGFLRIDTIDPARPGTWARGLPSGVSSLVGSCPWRRSGASSGRWTSPRPMTGSAGRFWTDGKGSQRDGLRQPDFGDALRLPGLPHRLCGGGIGRL